MTTYRLTVHNSFVRGGNTLYFDMTASEVAQYLAKFAKSDGKPEAEDLTIVAGPDKGRKLARFHFGRGQSVNAQEVNVVGLTVREIREAYKASQTPVVEFPDTCKDCGKPARQYAEWCPLCAKARYYIDAKGRGRFIQGAKPTHDQIIDRVWEGAVTDTARRRAERQARYANR